MKVYTQEDVVEAIRKEIAASSLRSVAASKGFSAPLISDMTLGKRNVSERVARAFGFIRELKVTKQIKFRKVA
jgi:hypothetical protein